MDDPTRGTLERPDANLLTLYVLQALLTVVAFPIVILPLYFRYHTLRYRFDDEGVSASWGILFRREVYLTYRRIQDIHVSRNIIQRWLGIATVEVQTASGSSTAELSFEGVRDHEALRDLLYARMRGTRPELASVPVVDETSALLIEIRDALVAARDLLDGRRPAVSQGSSPEPISNSPSVRGSSAPGSNTTIPGGP
jgi:putative membrane protein